MNFILFPCMNGSKEQKKSNDEKINYAQQGAAESAQFLIAVAVGIFGILAMFLMIMVTWQIKRA